LCANDREEEKKRGRSRKKELINGKREK